MASETNNSSRYRGEPDCRTCKLSREITASHDLCPLHGSAAIAQGDPPGVVRSGSVADLEEHLDTEDRDGR